MKKLISIILSFSIIVSILSVTGIYSLGIADKSGNLSAFVSDVKVMLDEYGLSDKNTFTTYSEEPNEFETRRLIVKSYNKIDTLNAVSVISGYRNLWVLQFETTENTENAFNYYKSLDSIEYVEADSIVTACETQSTDTAESTSEFLSWGPEHIGFGVLNDYLEESNIKLETVTVAVIDTGADASHEFLQGRVEPTDFNSSSSGKINDSTDDNRHGTHVAGIIVDCTPENVIIRPYKCLNNKGEGSDLSVSTGIYQAVDDGCTVINMSFGNQNASKTLLDSLEYAKEKNDAVLIAAMGNDATRSEGVIPYPAKSPIVMGISALYRSNKINGMSNYGSHVDLAAPGTNINSTVLNGYYKELSGTSMATPFVSAVAAMGRALYPAYSSSQIEALMKDTAVTLLTDLDEYGFFGNGMVNALGLLRDLTLYHDVLQAEAPVFNYPSDLYTQAVDLKVVFPEDATVYYTTDTTVPNRNSLVYDIDTPITVSESSVVTAIAFKDGMAPSYTTIGYYGVYKTGIRGEGISVGSGGGLFFISIAFNYKELNIPEIFNDHVGGKYPVTSATHNLITDYTISAIRFPKTLTLIEAGAFERYYNLRLVSGVGVETLGENTFKQCEKLKYLYFPNLKSIGNNVFNGSHSIEYIDMSGIEIIENENVFSKCTVEFIDLSSLKTAKSLPNNASVVLSSKFEGADCEVTGLTVYGTKGTYAEQWASEKGFEFIEAPVFRTKMRDSAYTGEIITVDAIGINKQYQWYASYDGTILNGILLEEETSKEFTVGKPLYAPYYYCIITSNDGESTTQFTTDFIINKNYSATKPANYRELNKTIATVPESLSIYTDETASAVKAILDSIDYSLTIFAQEQVDRYCIDLKAAIDALKMKFADYSELDKALESVPADLSVYTDETVAALNNALTGIERNLYITEQDKVDTWTENIRNAVASLEFKPADYSGLNAALSDIPTDMSIYTSDSVANLSNAVKEIDYSLNITQQATVDGYTENVSNAIANLQKLPADYTELDALIASVPEDLSIYTDKSVYKVNDILRRINRTHDITRQYLVDSQARALRNAINNLELKPEETTTEPVEATTVPIATTTQSTEPATTPVESTTKPETTKPVVIPTTAKPVDSTTATTRPTEPATKPFEIPSATKPVEIPTTKPIEPTTKPVEVTHTTKPTETTKPDATKADIVIKNPSVTAIKYGDSIILHAVADLPVGAKIVWTADNDNFSYVVSEDGKTCTITPLSSGNTTFTAYVVDSNGEVISNEFSQTMTSKACLFWKIIAFFKKLFFLTKVIPETVKFVF